MKNLFLILTILLLSATTSTAGGLFSGCMGSGFATNVSYRNETYAYIERVEADGGAVIDVAMVDAAYALLATYSLSPLVWVDANFGVKKDGSNLVSKLYDLSDNDHDAIQATATNQPTWTADKQNGMASIVYDGNDNFLTFGEQLGKPAAYTISSILSTDTISTIKTAYGNRLSSGATTPWGTGGYRSASNGDMFSSFTKESESKITQGNTSGSLITAEEYHLRTDKYTSGNTITIYLNTSSKSISYTSQTASENSGTSYNFVIGRLGDGTIYWDGDVASFIAFGSSLSDANRGYVEAFMESYYDVY